MIKYDASYHRNETEEAIQNNITRVEQDLYTWFTHSKNQGWLKTPFLINVTLKDPKNGLFPEDTTIKMQINNDNNNCLHVYINTNIKVPFLMLKEYNLVNY